MLRDLSKEKKKKSKRTKYKYCTLPSQYEDEYCSPDSTERNLSSCKTAAA